MASNRPNLSLVADVDSNGAHKKFIGELWTATQRQMHSMHYVVSYRASFKPELPSFCIKRYSAKGDIVLDPFSGRGTTALQANLMGRVAWAFDANPLAAKLTQAKTQPVGLDEVVIRLNQIDFRRPISLQGYAESFAPFYHPDTYRELVNLRNFVRANPDRVNNFIELLAISRLHGHSNGFFSVYSFPQISIPPESQRSINRRRHQEPEYRCVAPRIIKKASQALRDGFNSEFFEIASANHIGVADARNLSAVRSNSVDLIITSPPFLDKVDYIMDNWLECWFAGVPLSDLKHKVFIDNSLESWRTFIHQCLSEKLRVLKPNKIAVVEVGEVETQGEVVNLDEVVADEALRVVGDGKRFKVKEIFVNQQNFTKLANCFNVDNNKKGTNTNRLVVLQAVSKTPRKRAR